MTKRLLALLLALCMTAALLGACGRETPASPDEESASESTSAAETTEAETTIPEPQTDENGFLIPAMAQHAKITVRWVKDVKDQLGEYESITASEEEPQSHLVFFTDRTVTDFCVLSLFADSAGDEGDIRFIEYTIGHLDQLTPDRPLVLHTSFAGDLPNNGIRYKDVDGVTRHFTVELSGEDGSLQMTEYY